ncbi:hypothetical protein vBPaeMUSP18_14 [Pseudomonas phage vB_PaeM_USP_18]|nr:hypothetical protein vBPaeMUSP18_14 [Pseudomonas phage vB_PaeM_USP_18]QLI49482.1 hypothetical protein vBPaeMUSP25_14 [Pseudomonas phage vB_PaeM_USP_25]
MSKQDEFIQTLDGDMTPEQLAQLLELGDAGDTDEESDEGGVPTASADAGDTGAAGDAGKDQPNNEATDPAGDPAKPDAQTSAAGDAEIDPANAVVLAKDGKHTIPYDKLVQAREGEKHWKAQAEAAQRQLEELQAQSQARAEAGEAPTKTDNQVAAAQAAIDQGVDPGIFGDFSEEALAKGIATLVASQVEARVSKALEPIQAKQATDAATSHYDAIYAAHPDADSIAESKELADWIASQPSFVRSAYEQVFTNGSTTDVIELFDRFKQATGATQPATDPAKGDVKAKAKEAIDKAAAAVPASLSDFPGGRSGATSREEAMADMDGIQLLGSMDDMTPEQIEYYLNKL